MRIFTLSFILFISVLLPAQDVATFENFGLSSGEFLNDAGEDRHFESGPVRLPNGYNTTYDFWSGWAISATDDTTTPGPSNQYSSIAGHGVDGSETYAVTYAAGGSVIKLEGNAAGGIVNGLYITNNTYAYYSMLEGDAFAKKFGGETGDDPDFYLLTIKKYYDGALSQDSIDFYLADYRFTDNSQDYIVNDWNYIDLSSLGATDSLLFTLSSSDVGIFGMNTPAYFCVDNVETTDGTTSSEDVIAALSISVFPNPASEYFQIEWNEMAQGEITIYNAGGKAILRDVLQNGVNTISVDDLTPGLYFVEMVDRDHSTVQKLVIRG